MFLFTAYSCFFSFTDDVLIFFKHYDPKQKTLAYVGHLYIPLSRKFGKKKKLVCECLVCPGCFCSYLSLSYH